MKERIVPFIKYRFFAYALSLGLIVVFSIMTVTRGGIRMGVDFVGGQKIIARFEKGINEEKIRKALTAFSPTVQQIGEAEQQRIHHIHENHRRVDFRDAGKNNRHWRERPLPGMAILNERVVLMSSKDADR